MFERRITFRCRLLDDLHSGSGLGRLKAVDDCQARDRNGCPVVWHSTLRGLLRDVADELNSLGHALATKGRIRRLFGMEGRAARSAATVTSLHFERGPAQSQSSGVDLPVFLVATSTSREVHSRAPLEDTLRTIEYAAAGLIADGEIRFVGDDEDAQCLKLCLRRLVSLGGSKSRGTGRIQMQDIAETLLHVGDASKTPLEGCRRLRLLLRNLEPLCLPATAYAGNILDTESFLPGQSLRGAILTALSRQPEADRATVEKLADPAAVQFTNAYVVPVRGSDADSLDVARLCAMPLPLSAQERKATERKSNAGPAPWWISTNGDEKFWSPGGGNERDVLLQPPRSTEDADEQTTERFKRIKSDDYLVTLDGCNWRRVQPAFATVMRNRTPVARQSRTWDSRRSGAKGKDLTKAYLFSETVLVEDQLFVADLQFRTHEDACRFATASAPWLADAPEHRSWLRLGRGGRPVEIVRFQWLPDSKPDAVEQAAPDPPEPLPLPTGYYLNRESNRVDFDEGRQEPFDAGAFSLTLTSDLIARAADLGFHTTLTGSLLLELAGFDSGAEEGLQHIHVVRRASISETCVVHGYNTAAGTRRSSALAIRRGSAFLILGESRITELRDKLASLEVDGKGLGERTEEGFGRFVLNHPAHWNRVSASASDSGSGQAPTSMTSSGGAAVGNADLQQQQRLQREATIRQVLELADSGPWKKIFGRASELPKDFPSRNQWQRLRHDVEVVGHQEQLDRLLAELTQHAHTLGGRMWACEIGQKPLYAILGAARKTADGLSNQRTFLIYFCRWIVAQLERLAEERRKSS